jgi:hypothetical protein
MSNPNVVDDPVFKIKPIGETVMTTVLVRADMKAVRGINPKMST